MSNVPVYVGLEYPNPYKISSSSPNIIASTDAFVHLTRLFLCYEGSMHYKVILNDVEGIPRQTVGVSYADPVSGRTVLGMIENGADYASVLPYLNPGKGSTFTDMSKQPIFEFAYTYRGGNALCYTSPALDDVENTGVPNSHGQLLLSGAAPLDHNLILTTTRERTEPGTFAHIVQDVVWRKISDDFSLYVEVLPPQAALWQPTNLSNTTVNQN